MIRIRLACAAGMLYVALAMLLLMPMAEAAAQERAHYFDETGHSVSGPILDFFEANGGIAIFGYPIVEPFEDADGMVVQYFQRARFVLDPRAKVVRLGDLGRELREPDPARPPEAFSPAERYFAETGQAVGWEFRVFYEANGDQAIFGAPITGLFVEDDVLVQYFEHARFEWRYPESPAFPVRLTDLGTVAFARSGLNPDMLRPAPIPGGRLRRATALLGHASVAHPVLTAGQAQTVFFYLENQVGDPVAGALVRLEQRSKHGTLTVEMPPTDAHGLSNLPLPPADLSAGEMVVLRITAADEDLTITAETSFRVWW